MSLDSSSEQPFGAQGSSLCVASRLQLAGKPPKQIEQCFPKLGRQFLSGSGQRQRQQFHEIRQLEQRTETQLSEVPAPHFPTPHLLRSAIWSLIAVTNSSRSPRAKETPVKEHASTGVFRLQQVDDSLGESFFGRNGHHEYDFHHSNLR